MTKKFLVALLFFIIPMNASELRLQYEIHCNATSDINEHLPSLMKFAKQCSSITEIGVRELVSTWGLLYGLSQSDNLARSYLGIDLNYPEFNQLFLADYLAKENGIEFNFWQANDFEIDIEPTDLLFIDSWHTYRHLSFELEKFSPKVNKYIALHDTSAPWGNMDEGFYQGYLPDYPSHIDTEKRGLWPAVVDFLETHSDWELVQRDFNNHGFTVLGRNKSGSPPRKIPDSLVPLYTLNGQIPVFDWYIDGTYENSTPIEFKKETLDQMIQLAQQRKLGYYGATDKYLYELLDRFRLKIEGKKVAIIGSVTPWYEAIVLAYGGHPTTIEHNRIITDDPRLEIFTVKEFEEQNTLFDAVLTISSIEHDGLGRYGDPINPAGDFAAMNKIREMLKEDGILFLSIPVGSDALYWNAHRVYGKLRLPLLLKDWEQIDASGFSEEDLYQPGYTGHQPVFVLK